MNKSDDDLCKQCSHERLFHLSIYCTRNIHSGIAFNDRVCGCSGFYETYTLVVKGVVK